MNVLSCFDGISCGQIALQRAGIEYDNYYASEIDKYAISVTQHNHPNTIQVGDITKLNTSNLPTIDLLIGGSPCQSFSSAGLGKGFEGTSGLFWEFVRVLREVQPKYFLLENVKMKHEWRDIISQALGVEPIEIDSALVSAQHRRRLYWTNIPDIQQPADKGILLKDIVNFESTIPTVAETIQEIKKYTSRDFEVSISKSGKVRPHRLDYKKSGISEVGTIANPSDKSCTIIASHAPKTYKSNPFKIYCLTRNECEQLQTLPIGYTDIISEAQAKRAIGNGWTVDVIAHILQRFL